MMKTSLDRFFMLLVLIVFAQLFTSGCMSSYTYGGSKEDKSTAVASSENGNTIVGHSYSTSGDMRSAKNNGGSDFFVLHTDVDNHKVWRLTGGGSDGDGASCIIADKQGGWIICGFTKSLNGFFEKTRVKSDRMMNASRDVFVIKLDNEGRVQWKKVYGGSLDDEPLALLQHPDGSYVITGYTESNDGDFANPDRSDRDVFLLILNNDGSIRRSKSYSNNGRDMPRGIALDSSGRIVIAGWTQGMGRSSAVIPARAADAFVATVGIDGELDWIKIYGGMETDYAVSVIATNDSGTVVCGQTASNDGDFLSLNNGASDNFTFLGTEIEIDHGEDVFIAKLDHQGNIVWKRVFGGSFHDEVTAMVQDHDGSFVFTGNTVSVDGQIESRETGLFGLFARRRSTSDIYLAKMDQAGNVLWVQVYDIHGNDHASSLAKTASNGYVISGYVMKKGPSDAVFFTVNKDGED